MKRLHVPPGWGNSGFVIVIPAQNEALRLPVALGAFARDGKARDIIVVANGCTDATASIARRYPELPVAVLETARLAGGVGEARRLGLQAALRVAPQTEIVATSDADCVVMPGWARIVLASLSRADVVCGRVVPDPVEFARLPRLVRYHGVLEDRVSALEAELQGLRSPVIHDPLPRHNQTLGASLAFRTDAYLRAGGFEAIPCHEDHRLVDRIEAAGGRIARPWKLTVTASCRLLGRAPGGMADTIADRTTRPAHLTAETGRLAWRARKLYRAITVYDAVPQPYPTMEETTDVLSLR
ncbi:glycosyltransferase [uncultured Jannaschia sp.]|uniref:glycosyltransferase n=1 Tax=uncultured Jannaschia sp. TaxID=293347 RepID=UPI002614FCCE|nr:glycosyltransferase [uncultured Jannaschia sp.]